MAFCTPVKVGSPVQLIDKGYIGTVAYEMGQLSSPVVSIGPHNTAGPSEKGAYGNFRNSCKEDLSI